MSFPLPTVNSCAGFSHPESSYPSLSQPDEIPTGQSQGVGGDEETAKSKRNACVICRKRKLRCDGAQPSCATCIRLNHDCEYKEGRRRSGPRRGYVKSLETRLAQVEVLLKKQDTAEADKSEVILNDPGNLAGKHQYKFSEFDITSESLMDILEDIPETEQSQVYSYVSAPVSQDATYAPPFSDFLDGFSWELIELGIDESLPLQETIDNLNEIYFTKVHPSYPMIHQSRFLIAMNLSPRARPSIALRYAMWALAASTTEKYKDVHTHFYGRARKYAEMDELTGRHKYINLRHAQAWLLIATYEFKFMHYPNAWLTTGRATRLTQMMGLHRLDAQGSDEKQSLPECTDWIEKEERRRTFWTAFCKDRNGSIGTGWPMIIDERDIITHLPCSEEAYALNEECPSISLTEAMNPQSASGLSSFAGVVVITSLAGRTLTYLQRPSPNDDDNDMNGEFWKSHRKMDNILLNTSLYLPSHLRLPASSSNPNTIFLNMSLHAAIICVHQAAIFKAENNKLAASIVRESSARCVAAATEIASIMKMIAHMDLSTLNTYTTFILFLAIRIFGQIAKRQPEDDSAKSSVLFLLSALTAMKHALPLAEIYLVQLDLEGISLSVFSGKVEMSSGLEMGFAKVSVKDDIDDSSWVRYVSPLIKVTGTSEGSSSNSTVSPDTQNNSASGEPFKGQRFGQQSTAISPLGSGSYDTISSSISNTEQHSYIFQTPQFMNAFSETDAWDFGDTNVPTDLFDTQINMRP